jgi:ribosomal protein S19E (S16A)
MRWDDLTKEQQEALLSLEAGSGSMLTMEMVSQLIDLGLVEARTGGAALSKAGRRILLQRRDDGSAA